MTDVHRIHLQSGRYQIDLFAHAAGLIEVSIMDMRANNIHVFNGTLGSLIASLIDKHTFREACERYGETVSKLRGLLREAQFYSHNPDLDRRIADALDNNPSKKEEST